MLSFKLTNIKSLQAAANGDLESVKLLLNKAGHAADSFYPISNFLEVCDESGYNMLHAAIVNKRIKIIEELFDCGTSKLLLLTYKC